MPYIQQAEPVRKRAEHIKGRIKDDDRETQVRTADYVAGNFLRNRFVPLVQDIGSNMEWKQRQESFFTSIAYLSSKLGFVPLDVSNAPYPYNVHLSYKHALQEVRKLDCSTHLIIVSNAKGAPSVALSKPMDIWHGLYYIPIRPLVRSLAAKGSRRSTNLLLCICSYLLRIVHIPSYFDGDYVNNCYEYQRECLDEEYRSNGYDMYDEGKSELNACDYFGRKIGRTLRHPYHLNEWGRLNMEFIPKTEVERQVHILSQQAFNLFDQFPDRRLYRNIFPDLQEPEVEYRMRYDQYVSFIWSEEGWLSDYLQEYVNSDSQECGVFDTPLYFSVFDTPNPAPADDLGFEKAIFNLLEELATILNEMP